MPRMLTLRQSVLATGLGLSAWLAFKGAGTEPTELATAVIPAKKVQPARRLPLAAEQATQPEPLQTLLERRALIPTTTGVPRDLFPPSSWAPPPPVMPPMAPMTPEPPRAPPLPFSYLGKKWEGGRWEVYLSTGEHAHIAHEGDTIDAQYRIDKIEPPIITMTYLPLNQAQALPIGDFQ